MTFPLVCFGDSITRGYLVPGNRSFPALLERYLGMPVLNAGVDGDTSRNALHRLKRAVLRYQPAVVTVEFGANDARQGISPAELEQNLETIVREIERHGAVSVLLSLGLKEMSNHESAYFRAADRTNSPLIPNLLDGLTGSSYYTFDGIHPTTHGYEVIARRIFEFFRAQTTLVKALRCAYPAIAL
ncbi:MAG: GDSL-type esterase/lipase family protein [candidate division WOR-3 bacterium]